MDVLYSSTFRYFGTLLSYETSERTFHLSYAAFNLFGYFLLDSKCIDISYTVIVFFWLKSFLFVYKLILLFIGYCVKPLKGPSIYLIHLSI